MCKFQYDFVKRICREKAKFCYMDTDSFIVYVKTDDILKTSQKMLKQGLILQIMS